MYPYKLLKLLYLKIKFRDSKILSKEISKDIKLGTNILINPNVKIFNNAIIDDFSYINSGTLIGSNTRIGKYCSISYNCLIGLNEHPTNLLSTSPFLYLNGYIFNHQDEYAEDTGHVEIGNDVWIGAGAIVLKGVEIGNGAIIAAGAVVTKNVPPYGIVGGTPAKLIRYRFDDDTVEKLNSFEWWYKDLDELKKYSDYFNGTKIVENIHDVIK